MKHGLQTPIRKLVSRKVRASASPDGNLGKAIAMCTEEWVPSGPWDRRQNFAGRESAHVTSLTANPLDWECRSLLIGVQCTACRRSASHLNNAMLPVAAQPILQNLATLQCFGLFATRGLYQRELSTLHDDLKTPTQGERLRFDYQDRPFPKLDVVVCNLIQVTRQGRSTIASRQAKTNQASKQINGERGRSSSTFDSSHVGPLATPTSVMFPLVNTKFDLHLMLDYA